MLIGCNSKKQTQDTFFEIPIIEHFPELEIKHFTYDSTHKDSTEVFRIFRIDDYVTIRNTQFNTETKEKYTRCPQRLEYSSHFLEYSGTNLEVEYELPGHYSYNNLGFTLYNKYFIGVKIDGGIEKGFFIHWVNISQTLENYKNDTNQRKQKEYFEGIPWEIGSHTDSLETNLSYNEIKNLYPEFQGSYKHIKCDSIVIIHDSTRFRSHRNPRIYYSKQ